MTPDAKIVAARASAGTSAGPIYMAVSHALKSIGVTGKILDFGAGTGQFALSLCGVEQFSEVVAADLVDYDVAAHHPRLRWIFGDLNHPLPCDGQSFDAAVAVEVIEHLENPRFVVRELFRLLRPGGIAVISTPNNE